MRCARCSGHVYREDQHLVCLMCGWTDEGADMAQEIIRTMQVPHHNKRRGAVRYESYMCADCGAVKKTSSLARMSLPHRCKQCWTKYTVISLNGVRA